MTHGNVDSPEKQPGISFVPVLGRHGSMATYSPGNGCQLDDLSLPTSYLKVALDSVGIQNEGDLRQSIFDLVPPISLCPLVMLDIALRKRLTPL